MNIVNPENPKSPVSIKSFLATGEYDQGDVALISYDDLYDHLNKATVKKRNTKQFFNDLIVSLTKGKRKWTPTERSQFNRVAAFLDA